MVSVRKYSKVYWLKLLYSSWWCDSIRVHATRMVRIVVFSCSLLLLSSIPGIDSRADLPSLRKYHTSSSRVQLSSSKILQKHLSQVATIRGGDSKAGRQIRGKKPIGALTKFKEWLFAIPPISRAYILLAVFCSLIPAPTLFSLDVTRFYELWRPITAMAYLGTPSMSMANSIFFLLNYGQTLELEQGPGAYAWYLIVQTTILTLFGWLLGFPFQAQAMIASIIHVCSRMKPMDQIPFQFGLVITSWQLPFCMMAIDCLSQQSLSPAWPHILGIFSGHLYLFATKIWPALGGKPRLQPPEWIVRWLGDKPNSNVPGMDFKKRRLQENQQAKAASSRKKRRNANWLSGVFASKPKQNISYPIITTIHTTTPAEHTHHSISSSQSTLNVDSTVPSMKSPKLSSSSIANAGAPSTTATTSGPSKRQPPVKTTTTKTSPAIKGKTTKKPSKKE